MEQGFAEATTLESAERTGKALGRKVLRESLGVAAGKHYHTGIAASLVSTFRTRFALADLDAQETDNTTDDTTQNDDSALPDEMMS